MYDTNTIKEEKDEKGRLEIELKREFVSSVIHDELLCSIMAIMSDSESANELVEGELQSSLHFMDSP